MTNITSLNFKKRNIYWNTKKRWGRTRASKQYLTNRKNRWGRTVLCEMLPHWIAFLLCHFLQRLQQHGAACGRLSVNNAGSANAAARIGWWRYTILSADSCAGVSVYHYYKDRINDIVNPKAISVRELYWWNTILTITLREAYNEIKKKQVGQKIIEMW